MHSAGRERTMNASQSLQKAVTAAAHHINEASPNTRTWRENLEHSMNMFTC